MFSRRLLAVIFIGVLLFCVHDASAQTPLAPAAPAEATPPPPAPGMGGFGPVGKITWTNSISFGGSFTSSPFNQGVLNPAVPTLTGKAAGLQGDQRAIQTSASFFRSANLTALDIEGSYTYAVVQPVGRVQDSPQFSVDYDFRQRDGQRYFFLARYNFYKDLVRNVDYSHQIFGGVGVLAVSTKKVKIGLIPVAGTLHEKQGVPKFDGRWLAGWGAMERLVYTPNPYVEIEQREGYVQAFTDASFRGLVSTLSFKGKISKPLALMFNITQHYDNELSQAVTTIQVPGVGGVAAMLNTKNQLLMTGGIQITF